MSEALQIELLEDHGYRLTSAGPDGSFEELDVALLRGIRLRSEPFVEHLFGGRRGCRSKTHYKHVGVVPPTRTRGRLSVRTQSSADSGDFIGRDRGARAR